MKRRFSTGERKCIICETEKDDIICKVSGKGMKTFLSAMKKRTELCGCEVEKCIDTLLKFDASGNLILIDQKTKYWHERCCDSFASRDHIARLNAKRSLPMDLQSTSKDDF